MKIKGWQRSSLGRGRGCALLLLVLAGVALAGGYWLLGGKIDVGEEQFAAGEEELADGRTSLEEGWDELASGQRQLSEGKKEYHEAREGVFLVWADKLFKGGRGFKKARERIAAGERKIAEGKERLVAGERRVDVGWQKLRLGGERLSLARAARAVCAAGAFLFTAAAIVLGWRWR